jgi:hypothetical protein
VKPPASLLAKEIHMNRNETLSQRLARQFAETNPGFPVQVGHARAVATGEKVKLG